MSYVSDTVLESEDKKMNRDKVHALIELTFRSKGIDTPSK